MDATQHDENVDYEAVSPDEVTDNDEQPIVDDQPADEFSTEDESVTSDEYATSFDLPSETSPTGESQNVDVDEPSIDQHKRTGQSTALLRHPG